MSTETRSVPVLAETASSAGEQDARHGLYRIGLAYGRFIHRVRWLVIALWAAGLLASVPFAASLGSVLKGGGYSFNGSESNHVSQVMAGTLRQPLSQMVVVFQSKAAPVSDPAYRDEVDTFVGQMQGFPHLTDLAVQGPGKDGRTTSVVMSFDAGDSAMQRYVARVRALLPQGVSANAPARAYLTGAPATFADFNRISEQDIAQAERYSLPIALIVLLVVFGSLVAAAMPLTLALVSVPVALGVIYGIATHYDTTTFVENVATVVGLGISIDYSLFMTRRFRDELAAGRSVREAIAWTVATTGEAILFSGLTVVIGFVGLLLIGLQFMTSFGIGGAVVVATAVTAALTLLPALLSVLGPRVNALRVPLLARLLSARQRRAEASGREHQGFWHTWALAVMRRPLLTIVGVTVLLVGLGWPIFSMSLSAYGSASSLPARADSTIGANILKAQLSLPTGAPVYLVAESPDGSSMLGAANLGHVDTLSRWLAAQPHVTGVVSLTSLPATSTAPGMPASAPPTLEQLSALYASGAYQQSPALARLVHGTTSGATTLLTATTDAQVDTPAGKALLTALRAGDRGAAGGLRVWVGGEQASSTDFTSYVYGNFPRTILFILLATFALLLLMFRSVLLPLKAVLMNVLSLSASYGVLVWVFQWGHFSRFFGFTSAGNLDATVPILIFCILFGLSMDYEVFLLSRVREEWMRVRNNRYAVARGLEKTGGVITNAALLFVIVTGAFTFTSLIIMKEMGLGMTIAILVDAAVIRTLLVPATMRLLGRWNWWLPGRPVPVERRG
jgi:RND superfamily putative drug exporter